MRRFFIKKFCSFTYLNITQFLGTLNDNVFKLLIVFFLIDLHGIEKSPTILSSAGAIFVCPFLLFSATAGKLADRFSKRNIIVASKIMEVAIMCLGTLFFILKSPAGSYTTLFLMALQSSIFSPSKYGIVPELVDSDRITKANGLLTSFTILAIISGTFLASFITEISGRRFVMASVICVFIAITGMIASLYIEQTPPVGHKKKINPFFLYEIYKTLVRAKKENRLFATLMGCAYFLFIASFIQLNIIPFGIESLNLDDVHGGYLFMLTSLGIGAGSILAGKLSGPHVELGLVPFGGLGIALTCFLLYLFNSSLFAILPLIVILGMFGGIFEVPLESFIQSASPPNYRGQMVAAANFLGFLCVLGASGLLYLNSNVFGLKAHEGFAFVGIITLATTLIFSLVALDYFFRFIAFCISRICFRLTIIRHKNLTEKTPSIILCNNNSSFIDALLLTAIQRPPLHFFIESAKGEKKIFRFLGKIVRIILISPKQKTRIYNQAKQSLEKGYTVCVFTKDFSLNSNKPALKELQDSLSQTPYPVIPISIDEKLLHPPSRRVKDFLKNFPWNVSISIGAPETQ